MQNIVLIGILFFFISCNNSIVFEEHKSFDNQKWNTDSLVFFNYSVADTTTKNTVIIKLRHTVDYEFQNLFLFITTDVMDTVELMLANKEGKWLGNGVCDVREFEFKYRNEKLFSKTGVYPFKIEQAMRYGSAGKIQVLNNILSVGISIKKQDE